MSLILQKITVGTGGHDQNINLWWARGGLAVGMGKHEDSKRLRGLSIVSLPLWPVKRDTMISG